MQIMILRGDQQYGPYSLDDIQTYLKEGAIFSSDLAWHEGLSNWNPLEAILNQTFVISHSVNRADEENLIRRIADYERISGILWLVLAVIQICTIVGAIAGIWNIFAGISRLPLAKQIRKRDSSVPKAFEPIAGLVTIGVINLILGGVIGVLFVGFDFYIRDKILSNKHLFTDV